MGSANNTLREWRESLYMIVKDKFAELHWKIWGSGLYGLIATGLVEVVFDNTLWLCVAVQAGVNCEIMWAIKSDYSEKVNMMVCHGIKGLAPAGETGKTGEIWEAGSEGIVCWNVWIWIDYSRKKRQRVQYPRLTKSMVDSLDTD